MPPFSITPEPAPITEATSSEISKLLPAVLYSDTCIIAAASSASTILPLATTSAASSRLPTPCADNSVAIACALSTTSKSTSAVKLASIAPSFAPTTRPVFTSSTVMESASVR